MKSAIIAEKKPLFAYHQVKFRQQFAQYQSELEGQ
jgi:hypothetical protein